MAEEAVVAGDSGARGSGEDEAPQVAEEEAAEDASEEGVAAKAKPLQSQPTRDDVAHHNLTHIPYRSWCECCVKGRAVDDPHRRAGHGHSDVEVVSLDYCWMTETRQERLQRKLAQLAGRPYSKPSGQPILVLKTRNTQVVAASVVPVKGAHAHSVDLIVKFLKFVGERKVILKSDQEPAILALKDAVMAHSEFNVSGEESAVGDHSGNGAIEQAVQRVQGQTRVLKEALPARYDFKVDPAHVCLPWLIRHAAAVITRFQVGQDGRTGFQRLRGRPFRRDIAEFGECVLYLILDSVGEEKYNSRWRTGVFLGVQDSTNEVILGTPEGCVKARTIRRRSTPADRWGRASFDSIVGSPWALVPGRNDATLRPRVTFPAEREERAELADDQPRQAITRRAYLPRTSFANEWGYTQGCRGCQAILKNSAPVAHSELRRARISDIMRAGGDPRYDQETERLAAQVEELANEERMQVDQPELQAAQPERPAHTPPDTEGADDPMGALHQLAQRLGFTETASRRSTPCHGKPCE